jgi:type III restriction enzyme
MDEAARGLLLRRLQTEVPAKADDQRAWFEPYYGDVRDRRLVPHYQKTAQNLRRTLVHGSGLSPLGLLRSCLDYALNDNTRLGGVFETLNARFKVQGGRALLSMVSGINDFRNTYVAHQEKDLLDQRLAEEQLKTWIEGLRELGAAE